MTVCQALIDWRDSRRMTPRRAAAFFGISPDFYIRIETGQVDVGPSLAIDMALRTGFVVQPHDLPGASIPGSDTSGLTPPEAASVGEAAPGGVASPHLPALDANDGRGAWWGTYLNRDGAEHVVQLHRFANDDGEDQFFRLTPQHAAALGMDLIRAALLATRPGSVPA